MKNIDQTIIDNDGIALDARDSRNFSKIGPHLYDGKVVIDVAQVDGSLDLVVRNYNGFMCLKTDWDKRVAELKASGALPAE
jgi:hypothetical protein